ncbi:hypothetical protein H257_06910 [Aphanomyces astaci]|uniref:Uncharacterized protein n=1 Tax=Aphanomyces astaci TaxID=112090 RepID=W4GJ07_APHAT|nr:hypothetical protein H257_06910 [Aphanomyces astaci]ETV79657.1 hypothetical protein H257_06910 [Aphanomyces astaci]|eukprot:XP_009830593.1 hypothetical protein H257_06910 [Aphanomyces astaci]
MATRIPTTTEITDTAIEMTDKYWEELWGTSNTWASWMLGLYLSEMSLSVWKSPSTDTTSRVISAHSNRYIHPNTSQVEPTRSELEPLSNDWSSKYQLSSDTAY